MTYELTIEDNKEKPVIAFLKQLDFVKLKKVGKKRASLKKALVADSKELSYFGADINWDVEASDLRNKSNKRAAGW